MQAKFMTPAVTAFGRDGKLDRAANAGVYEYLIAGGMDGIVVMGSTGEFFAMPVPQRMELAKLAVETINHRTKTIIGTCSMCMEETVALTRHACDIGADAVIVVSPYYFKFSDESIESYYDTVASCASINVLLYNFPDRTGCDLTPNIVRNLLRRHRNIVGCKDTVAGMGHTRALIEAVRGEFPDFEVYSGFEENFAANVLSGGSGSIGGLSNIAVELFSSWATAVNAKDFARVAEIQQTVNALAAIYDVGTTFVPVVKKAMVLKGLLPCDACAAPMLGVNEAQTERIRGILAKLNLF